jgi:catechol 2,3-dioxygenase-like lactoylglutathione lyase family enzyme
MTNDTRKTGICEVGTVFVPVADQDRALAFYLDALGFEKRADFSYGGDLRWVEVAPPGAAHAIALVSRDEGAVRAGDETRCALVSDDIEASHAALRACGVAVDDEIGREGSSRPGLSSTDVTVANPVPPQFFFRDLDGNRFLVVPRAAA